MAPGVIYALFAAIFFGASTPLAKLLIADTSPVMFAGLMYFGSGLGLFFWRWCWAQLQPEAAGHAANRLTKTDYPWLVGAIVSGGIIGPVLLMTGLKTTPGSTASLLLNLEGVLTAFMAWFVFHENFDRRIFVGMMLIVGAGVLLSWGQIPASGSPWGVLAIFAACFFWALDNNLTRKISTSDAVQIAALKGIVAGIVNLLIAFAIGAQWPSWQQILSIGLLGITGYGMSLVLFVLALRHLGTARTGAYFSMAPFVGAILAIAMLSETPGLLFWAAALMMATGFWLHLSEQHNHTHDHAPLRHTHPHSHDEHHQHIHDTTWDGKEPHSHEHAHPPLIHKHPHYPDIHHQHRHST
jgi:drug/metabolite transporter (DMT)-like permease